MHQEGIWQHLRRSVISEDPAPLQGDAQRPKPIGDPGFYHPTDYVMRTCSWLRRFHILPEPGGLNQQDLNWVRDAELYFNMFNQVQTEYADYKKANSPTT